MLARAMSTEPEPRTADRSEDGGALRYLAAAIVAGAGVVLLYSLAAVDFARGVTVCVVGLMASGTCVVGGALLGFVFGIPRTLQQGDAGAPAKHGGPPPEERTVFQHNTNLEQISDWLTKILIGVGLTQMTSIPPQLWTLGGHLAHGLAPTAGAAESVGVRAFATALVLYFLITGFLLGYLWTRLQLPGALRTADVKRLGQQTQQIASEIEALKRQRELDDKAAGLVLRQLHRGPGEPPVDQAELEQALRAASRAVRVQAFYQAQEFRKNHWRGDRDKMARTIPLFRALIACDDKGRFHRNWGQLGYALKDQPQPDWTAAEAALTRAIALRGDDSAHGRGYYEANRAVCRIHRDAALAAGKPAPQAERDAIVADLKAAVQDAGCARVIDEDPTAGEWLRINGVDREAL